MKASIAYLSVSILSLLWYSPLQEVIFILLAQFAAAASIFGLDVDKNPESCFKKYFRLRH